MTDANKREYDKGRNIIMKNPQLETAREIMQSIAKPKGNAHAMQNKMSAAPETCKVNSKYL